MFAITQTLSQNVPVEEQLRQLAQKKKENGNQPAAEQQAEQHLRQLQNRYVLITHADSGGASVSKIAEKSPANTAGSAEKTAITYVMCVNQSVFWLSLF